MLGTLAVTAACDRKGVAAALDQDKDAGVVLRATADRPTAALPDAGLCEGSYRLIVGPAASPTDPALSDVAAAGKPLQKGFVAVEFTRDDGARFSDCTIATLLFRIGSDGKRRVETQRERTLKPTEDVFRKSWEISSAGGYEVVVREAPSGRELAAVRFEVQ